MILPPMGLFYVATYLKKSGIGVGIIDNEAEQLNINEVVCRILSNKSTIVGFGPTTPEFFYAVTFAREIKKVIPKIKICFGGPHVSALPDETMKNYNIIDFIVRHEGEETALELTRALLSNNDFSSIFGLSFRNEKGEIVHNRDRDLQEKIDIFPWPDRGLANYNFYDYSVPKKGMRPMMSVITARGCPFSCKYCYKPFKKKVRYRNPVDVVNEIEYWSYKYNYEYIVFLDETFTFNKEHVLTICDEMIKKNLNHIPWWCMTRPAFISEELLSKMKHAGCNMISIGVESGNQDMLRNMGKQVNIKDYEEAYRLIKKYGIEARASFIIGFPNETEETFSQTLNFAKKLDIDRVSFNIMTPLPGTELFEMSLRGDGIKLLTTDWSQFTRWGNAVIETPALTAERLEEMQEEALTEFYLQPKVIISHIIHYIKGERDLFYYRPVLFALERKFRRISLYRLFTSILYKLFFKNET